MLDYKDKIPIFQTDIIITLSILTAIVSCFSTSIVYVDKREKEKEEQKNGKEED